MPSAPSNRLCSDLANTMLNLTAHVCSIVHLPCSTADRQLWVQHAPLQVEMCFPATKMQQTSCYQYMHAHSLSLVGTTITSIADNSALLAFTSTCIYCAPKRPSVTPWGQRAIRLCWLVVSGIVCMLRCQPSFIS